MIACDYLAEQDPVLRRAYREMNVPDWRDSEASLTTLARAVVHQLLSVQAATTIWQRLTHHIGKELAPQAVLNADKDLLRACGLSRPKITYLCSIAQAIEDGVLNFEKLTQMAYEDARRELVAVKGIGPWTADLFLMTALGYLDAFPEGDVGLQESYRQIAGVSERLNSRAFVQLAESWRPYRGVAAHLLWAWLNHQRAPGRG